MPPENTPYHPYDPWQHCYGRDLSGDDETVELRVINRDGQTMKYEMTVDEWTEIKRSWRSTFCCMDCEVLADPDIKNWDTFIRKCPNCRERLSDVRSIVLASDDTYSL